MVLFFRLPPTIYCGTTGAIVPHLWQAGGLLAYDGALDMSLSLESSVVAPSRLGSVWYPQGPPKEVALSLDARNPGSLVGMVLEGAYNIDALIGEGGMGAVYSARHLRLNKQVAVKVMARELAASPDALARFHREAQVTSALGHPHIVQVLDFSTAPSGEPFLVMEFLEGEDLDRRIRRVGQLSPAATIHVVKQVASALTATHAKGIVHRDLKPANVFLLEAAGETDFVKVLDFGISKVRTATTRLTASEMVIGTPHYMSPEQALGRIDEIDETTDQWALACIAWECLSGAGPFTGESVPSPPLSGRARVTAAALAQGGRAAGTGRTGAPSRARQEQARPLRKRERLLRSTGTGGDGFPGARDCDKSREQNAPPCSCPRASPAPGRSPHARRPRSAGTAGEVEATVRVSHHSWRFWAIVAGRDLGAAHRRFSGTAPWAEAGTPHGSAIRARAGGSRRRVRPLPPSRCRLHAWPSLKSEPVLGKRPGQGPRGEAERDERVAPTREPAPTLRNEPKVPQPKAPKAKKSRPKVDRTLIEEL